MKNSTRAHLIEARKFRHWSQQEVADFIGTTQNSVSRWELGITTPIAYFCTKLCELFGKSAEELGLSESNSPTSTFTENGVGTVQTSSSPTNVLMLWTVPYLRNPHFTGRDELLHQLDQYFSPERQGDPMITRQVALTQPQAIKGLGGIGKTQIAVEYAYRAREQGRYSHIFWVNAAHEEAIITSLVTLAEMLPDFPAKDEQDQQKLAAAIKRWLEQCQQRWLLIFDNADDLSLVQKYFPLQGNGSMLLTTRANAVAALAASIDVENMGLMEGTTFLLQRSQSQHADDEERNEATNVVIALDGFPLALDQAGAYIEETGCGFREYLQLYQIHRNTLLARRGTQGTHYPDSVATTWSLSFQAVEQANPAAAELLRLCAYLSPDHIPEELIRDGAAHWPPLLQQAATDRFAFNQMFEELLRFSLVKRLVENQTLSIHRLVQAVQMENMEAEEQRQWAERVVLAVDTVFPRDPQEEIATWPLCLRYLEQAQACDTLIQRYQLLLPEAADLLDRTGAYLRERASYTLAEPLHQRALQIGEQRLGPEHAQVATSLNNLAILYYKQGKYAEAEPLSQRAIRIRERQLGLEHPQVALSLNNLANLYKDQGKFVEAEPLYQRALQIGNQQLGPDHPQVASTLNNLAILYYKQGKYAEAEPLYLRALQIREQQLGPEHPHVAQPLTNLANLYKDQGRYMEAEPLYQRSRMIEERQLGPDHPQVAHALTGLADIFYELGKYTEAEQLYQRVLRIWEQQLGPERPLVAISLLNLAILYAKQGRYVEAEPLYLRALQILEQRLGPEHPLVAYPLTGLADRHRVLGEYAEAERLYERALRIREQKLEPRHPDLAEALHGFAILREAQDNTQEAVSLYQRALTIREHVFGSQHPKTRETRERLRAALITLGRTEEAMGLNVAPQA